MQNSTEISAPRPFPMNFDFHLGETRMEAGQIVAERFFGEKELVFAGHFPSNKILPGVMLVEFALYLGETYLRRHHDRRQLSKIDSATFLAPVFPGGKVRCRCEFSRESGDILAMKAVLQRDEVTCAKVRAAYARR